MIDFGRQKARRYHVGIASVFGRWILVFCAVSLAMFGLSAQAKDLDIVSFAMDRCILPASKGRSVNTTGMKRLPAGERAKWEQEHRSAKAYAFPIGTVSNLAIPNPVLVVPRGTNEPVCRLIHKGLEKRQVRRLVDGFGDRTGVEEDRNLKSNFDGAHTRGFKLSVNGKSYVVVFVSVPFLKSNSVEVYTSRAFAKLGDT